MERDLRTRHPPHPEDQRDWPPGVHNTTLGNSLAMARLRGHFHVRELPRVKIILSEIFLDCFYVTNLAVNFFIFPLPRLPFSI